MKKQAEHFGAEYLHGTVVEADLSEPSLSPENRRRVARSPHADHRFRRFGALAESAQ